MNLLVSLVRMELNLVYWDYKQAMLAHMELNLVYWGYTRAMLAHMELNPVCWDYKQANQVPPRACQGLLPGPALVKHWLLHLPLLSEPRAQFYRHLN